MRKLEKRLLCKAQIFYNCKNETLKIKSLFNFNQVNEQRTKSFLQNLFCKHAEGWTFVNFIFCIFYRSKLLRALSKISQLANFIVKKNVRITFLKLITADQVLVHQEQNKDLLRVLGVACYNVFASCRIFFCFCRLAICFVFIFLCIGCILVDFSPKNKKGTINCQ